MADDTSKKRLGKGLAALIGDVEVAPISTDKQGAADFASVAGQKHVPTERIVPNPNNPRREFDEAELEDLSQSIREHGIMQPIVVREEPGGAPNRFEIIAGERRWRAAQRAKLHEVPVIVKDVDDRVSLELAIVENVQRSDLNSVEEALGYQRLMDEHDYTQNDLSQVIGKSRSHVANTLRLLKLPEDILGHVASGALSAGHARTLVTAESPEKLAKAIMDGGLSVRQAEQMAQAGSDISSSKASGGKVDKSADILALEKTLSDHLGLKSVLAMKGAEKGNLSIEFKSLSQLDDVLQKLGLSQ